MLQSGDLPITTDHWKSVKSIDMRGLDAQDVNLVFTWFRARAEKLESLKMGWLSEANSYSRSSSRLNRVWFQLQQGETAPLISKCVNLQTLVISGYDSSLDLLLPHVNCFSKLSVLNFNHGIFGEAFLIGLVNNNFATLKDINLRATDVTDKSLASISRCANLERINLSCTEISVDGFLEFVSKCSKLKEIDLCYSSKITSLTSPQIATLLAHISQNVGPRLSMIGIGGFPVTDDSLFAFFSVCTNVSHIGIGGCELLTDRSFDTISTYLGHCLRDVNAHQLRQISEKAWRKLIESSPKLQILDASGSTCTDSFKKEFFKRFKSRDVEDW